ncbi:hypothetical protein T492DRAFT_931674, partial [Pavlovales sp. CCMP2436]
IWESADDEESNDWVNPLIHTDEQTRKDARGMMRYDLVDEFGARTRPTYEDKLCIYMWCADLLPVHSTRLSCHIAFGCCSDHPQKELMMVAVAGTVTAKLYTSKLARLAALADEVDAWTMTETRPSSPNSSSVRTVKHRPPLPPGMIHPEITDLDWLDDLE